MQTHLSNLIAPPQMGSPHDRGHCRMQIKQRPSSPLSRLRNSQNQNEKKSSERIRADHFDTLKDRKQHLTERVESATTVLSQYFSKDSPSHHDQRHGCRVALMSTIGLDAFMALNLPESSAEIERNLNGFGISREDLRFLVFVTGLLHDSGRPHSLEGDAPDRPEWERESGRNITKALKDLNICDEIASLCGECVVSKDFRPSPTSFTNSQNPGNEALKTLISMSINLGDCCDIERFPHTRFNPTYTTAFKLYPDNWQLASTVGALVSENDSLNVFINTFKAEGKNLRENLSRLFCYIKDRGTFPLLGTISLPHRLSIPQLEKAIYSRFESFGNTPQAKRLNLLMAQSRLCARIIDFPGIDAELQALYRTDELDGYPGNPNRSVTLLGTSGVKLFTYGIGYLAKIDPSAVSTVSKINAVTGRGSKDEFILVKPQLNAIKKEIRNLATHVAWGGNRSEHNEMTATIGRSDCEAIAIFNDPDNADGQENIRRILQAKILQNEISRMDAAKGRKEPLPPIVWYNMKHNSLLEIHAEIIKDLVPPDHDIKSMIDFLVEGESTLPKLAGMYLEGTLISELLKPMLPWMISSAVIQSFNVPNRNQSSRDLSPDTLERALAYLQSLIDKTIEERVAKVCKPSDITQLDLQILVNTSRFPDSKIDLFKVFINEGLRSKRFYYNRMNKFIAKLPQLFDKCDTSEIIWDRFIEDILINMDNATDAALLWSNLQKYSNISKEDLARKLIDSLCIFVGRSFETESHNLIRLAKENEDLAIILEKAIDQSLKSRMYVVKKFYLCNIKSTLTATPPDYSSIEKDLTEDFFNAADPRSLQMIKNTNIKVAYLCEQYIKKHPEWYLKQFPPIDTLFTLDMLYDEFDQETRAQFDEYIRRQSPHVLSTYFNNLGQANKGRHMALILEKRVNIESKSSLFVPKIASDDKEVIEARGKVQTILNSLADSNDLIEFLTSGLEGFLTALNVLVSKDAIPYFALSHIEMKLLNLQFSLVEPMQEDHQKSFNAIVKRLHDLYLIVKGWQKPTPDSIDPKV